MSKKWIVVLGCPARVDGSPSSPMVRRLSRALQNFRVNDNASFLLMGGAAHNDTIESLCMRDWLLARGIDDELIWTEEETRDTKEQAETISELLKSDPFCKVYVVSDLSHLPRTRMLLKKHDVDSNRVRLLSARLPKAKKEIFSQIAYEVVNYALDYSGVRLPRAISSMFAD